jgi:hypothetical protein
MRCSKCDGALLPVRAVNLDIGVVEYLCINCRSHWLLIDTPSGLVLTFSPQSEQDRLGQAISPGH